MSHAILNGYRAMATCAKSIKEQAHAFIDNLPDDVTWADMAEKIDVIADVEAGLAESEANLGVDADTLRERFKLPA